MKIAHFAVYSPNLSGMYATVKDLIRAERLQGIEAEFIDYNIDNSGKPFSKVGYHDEDIVTISPDWACEEADIIVRHSLITEPISRIGTPIIMAMHGRPEYSYMLEHYGKSPVMQIMCNHETDTKYSAYLSFWEEHELFWSLMMPKRKVHYVPSVVDLKRFNPDGAKYTTSKWNGRPNILVCDMWREDVTPFNAAMGVVKFKQKYCHDAKLQLFGLPPAGKGFVSSFAERLLAADLVGETNALVPHLDTVYRGADILVTPHSIATRVIREALASGLPIVAGTGCKYTKYTADARDPEALALQIQRCWMDLIDNPEKVKSEARNMAERCFSYDLVGKAMVSLGNEILEKKDKPTFLPIEWTGFSIDPTDWVVLRDVLKDRNIKRVVEFGSGVSTQVMDRMGIEVHSFETDPIYVEKIRRITKNAKLIRWNGVYPPALKDYQYQLAFIDGPVGGENREPSYAAVASSNISIVACHDYKRKEDKNWIDKYFSGWKEIARADESKPGLLILEKV